MEYTVVSGGTERACILGMNNTPQSFPMSLGYCGVGFVEDVGSGVKKVLVGDRVLVYHGYHSKYNIRPEDDITKIEKQDLTNYFREFNQFSHQCRFTGCTHKNAADCKVMEMVEKGVISENRYKSYLELFEELSQINRYK